MRDIGFKLYLLFTASWYLHLASRIPVLGTLRIDLLLALLLLAMAFIGRAGWGQRGSSDIEKILKVLIIYAIATFPLAKWPGTVLKIGLPAFIKAFVFYYFTVSFIDSERKLKILMFVYLACQTFRVLEPLYLHITEGYWGSAASMLGGAEFMMRLSGAPADVVNPNGLASIIFSIFPFLYFYAPLSWKNRVVFALLTPPLLYAMVLTGSRSGIIGLGVALIGIVYKSNKKAILIPAIAMCAVVIFLNLSPDQQDRYLSIVKSDTKHGSTAHGRITGIEDNFRLFMKRPVFGFGLGTAEEANYHYGTSNQPPHNLYMEIGIQLGLFGIILFVLFMKSTMENIVLVHNLAMLNFDNNTFLVKTINAVQILFIIEVIFSLSSYGLFVPSWYFLGGLSAVLISFVQDKTERGFVAS